MNIPNFVEHALVDKNGMLTDVWKQTLMDLFTQLQKNLSNEGIVTPSQPTTTITQLNTPTLAGALIYDSTTNQLKVNINGTFKVIQTL